MRKKNKTRAIATYAMVSALVLSATGLPVKAAGQWQQTNGVWNYTNEGKVSKGWQEIDNNWYSFDETGKMQTGWIASAEHWYFLGGSGIMQNDAWVTDTDGSKFYIKGTGVMATDYVKDGFELTADGKAVPLADSKSVVLTNLSNLEGTTIEGNLYVDATLAKELLIKGVTVTGKLVLLGDNKTTTKLTITDSNINAISTQTRDSEIVLSGTTSVKSVVLQETTKVTPDASFKGQVDTIEVQSTTKGEVVVSVPAKEVSSRTFATVDIQAPVDKLDIKTNTTVNINADVKEVAINEFAGGTKVEVSKGNTVGKIDTEVKVEVGGSGSVDEVTGAGKDESIVTPKPERPTTGGGSTTPTPPVTPTPEGLGVSNEAELITALNDTTIDEIYLKNDIELKQQVYIERPLVLNGEGKKLYSEYSVLMTRGEYLRQVIQVSVKDVTVKNLVVEVTGHDIDFEQPSDHWNSIYGLKVYDTSETPDSTKVILENVTSRQSDVGIHVNGSEVILKGTTDVSGNEYGGIEVSRGKLVGENSVNLTLSEKAEITNESESYTNPVLWTIVASQEVANEMINGFENTLYKGPDITDGENIKNHYYKTEKHADAIVVKNLPEIVAALQNDARDTIVFSSDIEVDEGTEIKNIQKENLTIDLNGYTIFGENVEDLVKKYSTTIRFYETPINIQNGAIRALEGVASTILVGGFYGTEWLINIDEMQLFNNTEYGNSIKIGTYCTANITNTTSTSYMGGGMEAAGGTINVKENNTFTQTGFSADYGWDSTIGAASNGGTLNIHEGIFTSENYGLFVFNSGGTINVYDGEFKASKAVLKANKSVGQYDPTSTINIYGGAFYGKLEIQEGAVLNITGGTFMNTELSLENFEAFVADGYEAIEANGVFTVVAKLNTKNVLTELSKAEVVNEDEVIEEVNSSETINIQDELTQLN